MSSMGWGTTRGLRFSIRGFDYVRAYVRLRFPIGFSSVTEIQIEIDHAERIGLLGEFQSGKSTMRNNLIGFQFSFQRQITPMDYEDVQRSCLDSTGATKRSPWWPKSYFHTKTDENTKFNALVTLEVEFIICLEVFQR